MAGGYQYTDQVDRARANVSKALRSGGWFVTLRAWDEAAVIAGDATHCPLCYDPAYGGPRDERCPACYGTGFTSGFSSGGPTVGIVRDVTAKVERTEYGTVVEKKSVAHLPWDADVETGDLLVEVPEPGYGGPPGARWLVDDAKQVRLRMHYLLEKSDYPYNGEVVGWSADVHRLPDEHPWQAVLVPA